MKSVWTLVLLAVCAVMVVAFHTIKQEMNIHRMRKLIVLNTEEVKTMENEIMSSKLAMQKLSSQLAPLDEQKKQLIKSMEEQTREKENSEQSLNTCQIEKSEFEQQKSEKDSAINMLKTNLDGETEKVQEEIQLLQKQILERDTKICLYVDKAREEGRALCQDKMAASN
ncbi:golgin subfamily A member 6-like protein 22 [Ictalurus furcatus]|uniref:golgin subfamily A member 6-like protein 22 n=1 Tax=Ictalurus furcatus TaxID=66913 RepID=UPI00234FF164|nr:golgin subfamily A member 6-like protein 22 [Ictalurus furcatus]